MLKKLFQFDNAELDFGIYRIMNHKRVIIERFIEKDLIQGLDKELKRGAHAEQADLARQLAEATVKIRENFGDDALDAEGNLLKGQDLPLGKDYQALRERAAGAKSSPELEAEIFNHLYAFFSRYYDDGDFMSLRRYSRRDKYAIPYNGEEVHLHWANADQYYIKTGENFTDYSYKHGGWTVRFKLRNADVEQNNVKGANPWNFSRGVVMNTVVWTLFYVNASHGARRGYQSRSYVDLYCGPARSWIRETGVFIDGSPLVAFDSAGKHGDQFTEIFIADAKDEYLKAAESRLRARGANVRPYSGDAHVVVDQVISALNPYGLHLAFLDPYSLGGLPFSIIQKLASVKRMDLIIHVSAMDLKRDLHNYVRSDGPKDLDEFAPRWRDHVNTKQRQDLVRQEIFDYWRSLIKGLGTSPSDCIEAVENSKSSDLYWLVFVARHELAHKLWEAIANVSPQTRLF